MFLLLNLLDWGEHERCCINITRRCWADGSGKEGEGRVKEKLVFEFQLEIQGQGGH